MRLGENLLTASNISGASNNHTETAFRTSFENRVRRLKCRCFGGLWFERVVRIEVVETHGRAAWRMGRRAWAGAAGPDVRPAICAADAPAQVRCCGSTKLQSLHVLLSDVAGGTAATSASSAFDDRRWKAWHCYRAQPPTAPDRPFNRNANVPASGSCLSRSEQRQTCNRIQGKYDRSSGLLKLLKRGP